MKKVGIVDIDGTINNLDFFSLIGRANLIDININNINNKLFRLLLFKIVLIYSKNIKARKNVKYALDIIKMKALK